MNKRRLIFYVLIVVNASNPLKLYSQEAGIHKEWLARGAFFTPVILDPSACISSGGLMRIKETESFNKGIYIPVNIGFEQSIYRLQKSEFAGIEFGFGGAAFTQFVIKEVEQNTYLGEIENTDFKASGFINFLLHDWSARLRLFHISSHLADDYILRNNITTPNPGTVNYEQLDLTVAYQKKIVRYYAGVGVVITPHAIRKRLSLQSGMYIRKKINKYENIRWAGGLDLKLFEQNNFRGNLKTAIGMELGSTDKTQIGIFLEYYNGHLPYSTLEYKIVQWAGISAYLIPALPNLKDIQSQK